MLQKLQTTHKALPKKSDKKSIKYTSVDYWYHILYMTDTCESDSGTIEYEFALLELIFTYEIEYVLFCLCFDTYK